MGHSAQVEMRLLLDNGNAVRIGQTGPDFLILDSPVEHPPSDATIELRIDASERRWKVRPPEGISSASLTVTISKAID